MQSNREAYHSSAKCQLEPSESVEEEDELYMLVPSVLTGISSSSSDEVVAPALLSSADDHR